MKASLKRVIVGLSGGVDSAVAAFLLQKEGYQVEALFMKNWEEDDNNSHCPANVDLEDAAKISDILKIPLHVRNFAAEYWDSVFEHFLTEHRLGRTPNPDILCNQEIKFKAFLNTALELGADLMATGHYAQNFFNSNRYYLQRAIDPNKDQSYFLYTLQQNTLPKALFPIGHLEKSKVRKIASEAGFANSQKKDSTGICFIGKRKFKPFLNQYLKKEPGPIKTPDNKVIGLHDGLMFYTLGQRQGLKIGGQKNTNNTPWYVVGKDLKNNVLTVAQGDDHPLLYSQTLTAQQLLWVNKPPSTSQFECTAKIRYRQKDEPCTVTWKDQDTCEVVFHKPQRAITPGQSVVFYDQQFCLGGGIIQ